MALLSLIARCHRTGQIGFVNYADRRAVGARLGRFKAGVGACIVQGALNPRHEKWALDLLSHDITPEEALISSTLRDRLHAHRQILLLSGSGESGLYKGKKTPLLAHACQDRNFVAGGTNLPSTDPVDAIHEAMTKAQSSIIPLESILMGALESAQIAAPKMRGDAHSASLKLYNGAGRLEFDLRVDASRSPIAHMRHLLDLAHHGKENQSIRPEKKSQRRLADKSVKAKSKTHAA
jgi:uncharacterized Ntn-hydrolase superfamily protein